MGKVGPLVETCMQTPFGDFHLRRYPLKKRQNLRAWDAADEYLLDQLYQEGLSSDDPSVLIMNDSFGGLSLPLHTFRPVVMTDSYLAMQSVLANKQANTIDEKDITLIDSLHPLDEVFSRAVDVVLLKLPKSLAMLEDQLFRLRACINDSTLVIAAGMTRNIHNSTSALFEKIIGPTQTSLAKKKARLVFSAFDASLDVGVSPYPRAYTLPYRLDDRVVEISNHANVFSHEKLDIGTRLFIDNLPADERYRTILDLGCGNGVLGLMAAIANPQASTIFTDESYMAVDSAITNYISVLGRSSAAEFLQTDCLSGVDESSVSLILCNPPFHQSHAITDDVAWQMFSEAKTVLHDAGELWVIGNRHLGYHAKLKHLFGNCTVVASDKKFTLLKAVKNSGQKADR